MVPKVGMQGTATFVIALRRISGLGADDMKEGGQQECIL